MNVRVDAIRPMKRGGAVIGTPSIAGAKQIVANSKFAEAGLVVGLNPERGTRIAVVNVYSQITPDEFMQNLYSKNLNDVMSPAAFEKMPRW